MKKIIDTFLFMNEIDLLKVHFSYFMTPYNIKEKINAIAEVEKLDEYLNLQEQEIAKRIFAKQDLYGRNLDFKNQNGLIPADLSNLIKHYLPYLIGEE